jgi:serine/threonine protein kinase
VDPSRWQRIQEIFHSAAALDGDARRAFLEASCQGDPELRAEVEALLAEDARTSPLLDGGLRGVAERLVGGAHPPPPRVGPYAVTGVLGEGGMGVVYRAERADLPRAVALKVLRDAWLSPSRRGRFASEQRILAQLDHPSIAHLYDAGALPDGTPWFAMELFEGLPLTEWCARRKSPLRERLALFRSACEAVAFAHRHAVVHRDLKPSNVLVGGDGAVKLLDFGIAKHLDPDEALADATRTGLAFMTPAYAAPEQLRGEHPGLHTDVWALGVILFELVAGHRPFDPSGAPAVAVEAAILQRDPERPSAAARRAADAPVRASRAEWQDLDVLCLTALQKDASRRYPSAEALLRDVDRFLEGRPLEARADSAPYRVGKFVRRHRWPVAALALATAAVAATALFYTARLARARDAALAAAGRAQHVQGLLQDLLEGGDKEVSPAADLRVLTLLDRGAREAETLTSEPATQADLLETLGIMYSRIGQLERADALLGRALDRHRALRGPEDPTVIADLVALGRLRLDQARGAEAERLVRDAIALGRRVLPDGHPALADALVALGTVLNDASRYADARGVLQEAVALRSRRGAPPLDLAAALARLADVEFASGRFAEADALNDRALGLYRSQLGERHPRVADRLLVHAGIHSQWREVDEADLASVRQAVEIFRGWHGPDHPRTAAALNDLGLFLETLKRYDEADPPMREALAIQERLYGKVHPTVAGTVHSLASLAYFRRRYGEAAELCRRATAIWRAVYGETHMEYGQGLACEATVLLRAGTDPVKAEALLRESLSVLRPLLPAGNFQIATGEAKLGFALYQQGRFAEAEPHSRGAFELLASGRGPEVEQVMQIRDQLIAIYEALGRPEEAARLRAEQGAIRAKAAPRGAGADAGAAASAGR